MATDETRKDLDAAVRARRDLGPEYEAALVESFLERLDREAAQRAASTPPGPTPLTWNDPTWVVAMGSVVAGIPITALSGSLASLPGMTVAWGGIAAVNVALNWGRRRR